MRRAGAAPVWPSQFKASERSAMPSLFRFLFVVAILAGLVYGAMYALATMVAPQPREMSVTIPPDRFYGRTH
jgi:hypothetical protein